MKRFLVAGDKAIRKINDVLYIGSILMLVGMTLNVVLAVLFNKVLSRAFPIPVDYTAYLLLLVAALGYAGYQYKNGFVRVTMLQDALPPLGKKIFELFNFVVLIGFYFFLAYQCFLAAAAAKSSGVAMMAISWKLYPYYYALAFGIIWTAIVTVFQLIKYLYTGDLVNPPVFNGKEDAV